MREQSHTSVLLLELLGVTLLSSPGLASAKQGCARLGIPELYSDGSATAYGPAAAWTDNNGWLGFAQRSQWTGDARECLAPVSGSPLVMYMGKSHGPDVRIVKATTHEWDVDVSQYDWEAGCRNTTDLAEDCKQDGLLAVQVLDYRPFVWNHQLRVTVTVHLYRTDTGKRLRAVQGIALPNFSTRMLELQHVFFDVVRRYPYQLQPPLQQNHEKAWGIFEVDGRQMMVYSLFPCLVLLDVIKDGNEMQGIRFTEASCYHQSDSGPKQERVPALEAAGPTGLHISGHPQIWKDSLHVVGHTL